MEKEWKRIIFSNYLLKKIEEKIKLYPNLKTTTTIIIPNSYNRESHRSKERNTGRTSRKVMPIEEKLPERGNQYRPTKRVQGIERSRPMSTEKSWTAQIEAFYSFSLFRSKPCVSFAYYKPVVVYGNRDNQAGVTRNHGREGVRRRPHHRSSTAAPPSVHRRLIRNVLVYETLPHCVHRLPLLHPRRENGCI